MKRRHLPAHAVRRLGRPHVLRRRRRGADLGRRPRHFFHLVSRGAGRRMPAQVHPRVGGDEVKNVFQASALSMPGSAWSTVWPSSPHNFAVACSASAQSASSAMPWSAPCVTAMRSRPEWRRPPARTRRRGGAGVSDAWRRARSRIQQRRAIPHRPRHRMFGDDAGDRLAQIWKQAAACPRRFQPDQSAARCGNADRAEPVGRVRHRHHALPLPPQIRRSIRPACARGPRGLRVGSIQLRLAGHAQTKLAGVGLAEYHQARRLQPAGQECIFRGHHVGEETAAARVGTPAIAPFRLFIKYGIGHVQRPCRQAGWRWRGGHSRSFINTALSAGLRCSIRAIAASSKSSRDTLLPPDQVSQADAVGVVACRQAQTRLTLYISAIPFSTPSSVLRYAVAW